MAENNTTAYNLSEALNNTESRDKFGAVLTIPLYSLIFVLSVTGNVVVILTLVLNRRMRSVTNVFLLNLAISDLLLGVFCMPFTLIGSLLRDFIFGAFMCKLIPYLQAITVSVGVWTLVSISMERYFAICRPLTSRRWQTRSHSHKIITIIWFGSFLWNLPICILSSNQPIGDTGRHKCREVWPNPSSEKIFNLFLDVLLLIVPLVIMCFTYTLIALKLWKGMKQEKWLTARGYMNDDSAFCSTSNCKRRFSETSGDTPESSNPKSDLIKWVTRSTPNRSFTSKNPMSARKDKVNRRSRSSNFKLEKTTIRSNHTERSIQAKQKVIQMLFVIVLEFFLCWAPLYVMHTCFLYHPRQVYEAIGPTGVSLIQLLAYISSCCNPITYCLMHQKFRSAFLNTVRCRRTHPVDNMSTSVNLVTMNERNQMMNN